MDVVKKALILLTLLQGSCSYEQLCAAVLTVVRVDSISKQFGELLNDELIAFGRPCLLLHEVRLTGGGFVACYDMSRRLGFDRMATLPELRAKVAEWTSG